MSNSATPPTTPAVYSIQRYYNDKWAFYETVDEAVAFSKIASYRSAQPDRQFRLVTRLVLATGDSRQSDEIVVLFIPGPTPGSWVPAPGKLPTSVVDVVTGFARLRDREITTAARYVVARRLGDGEGTTDPLYVVEVNDFRWKPSSNPDICFIGREAAEAQAAKFETSMGSLKYRATTYTILRTLVEFGEQTVVQDPAPATPEPTPAAPATAPEYPIPPELCNNSGVAWYERKASGAADWTPYPGPVRLDYPKKLDQDVTTASVLTRLPLPPADTLEPGVSVRVVRGRHPKAAGATDSLPRRWVACCVNKKWAGPGRFWADVSIVSKPGVFADEATAQEGMVNAADRNPNLEYRALPVVVEAVVGEVSAPPPRNPYTGSHAAPGQLWLWEAAQPDGSWVPSGSILASRPSLNPPPGQRLVQLSRTNNPNPIGDLRFVVVYVDGSPACAAEIADASYSLTAERAEAARSKRMEDYKYNRYEVICYVVEVVSVGPAVTPTPATPAEPTPPDEILCVPMSCNRDLYAVVTRTKPTDGWTFVDGQWCETHIGGEGRLKTVIAKYSDQPDREIALLRLTPKAAAGPEPTVYVVGYTSVTSGEWRITTVGNPSFVRIDAEQTMARAQKNHPGIRTYQVATYGLKEFIRPVSKPVPAAVQPATQEPPAAAPTPTPTPEPTPPAEVYHAPAGRPTLYARVSRVSRVSRADSTSPWVSAHNGAPFLDRGNVATPDFTPTADLRIAVLTPKAAAGPGQTVYVVGYYCDATRRWVPTGEGPFCLSRVEAEALLARAKKLFLLGYEICTYGLEVENFVAPTAAPATTQDPVPPEPVQAAPSVATITATAPAPEPTPASAPEPKLEAFVALLLEKLPAVQVADLVHSAGLYSGTWKYRTAGILHPTIEAMAAELRSA